MSSDRKLDIGMIADLYLIDRLTPTELEVALDSFKLEQAGKGAHLVDHGSTDESAYYLLNGSVTLYPEDGGRPTKILHDEHRARQPISHLVPHHYTVICDSDVEYLRVPTFILHNLLERQDAAVGSLEELSDSDLSLIDNPLFQEIQHDLLHDQLVLPQLPDVARKVVAAVSADADFRDIEQILLSDAAMTTMLLKVANSPLYRGHAPITQLSQAMQRLGLNAVRNFVVNTAMQSFLITDNEWVNRRLHTFWQHSTEVAAIAHVMANRLGKRLELNPDQALLCGLIHDVGALPIIKYSLQQPELLQSTLSLDQLVTRLHGSLGGMILKRWGFADIFVDVAEQADNWERNHNGPADYVDLVMMAQLHSFMGKQLSKNTPPMEDRSLPLVHELPAFTKLGLQHFGPKESVELLRDAKKEVVATMNLLAA